MIDCWVNKGVTSLIMQIKTLEQQVQYLKGDYHAKGREFAEPNDPYEALKRDYYALKKAHADMTKEKDKFHNRCCELAQKVNTYESEVCFVDILLTPST